MSTVPKLSAVVPLKGQILIEDEPELVLCKPRLIPLKSFTLEKLEKMQEEARKAQQAQQEQDEESAETSRKE